MNHFREIFSRLSQRIGGPFGFKAIQQQITGLRTSVDSKSRESQLLLQLAYQNLLGSKRQLPSLDSVEFRTFSQNGEDGILWYIFSLIGTRDKRCVEICAGNGLECNTANLIINHGWTGLLFDGDPGNVAVGNAFYARHPDTFTYPPRFINAWIDAENINHLISNNGLSGDIDLLSLDIDGVDYWLWKAITAVRPRVVVAEVQAIWGSTRSMTVPYRPDFRAEYVDGFGVYSGGSLAAFVKLARSKGYRLIGAQRYGFNAFFMRDDVGTDIFPEVPAVDCMRHPFVAWAQEKLLPLVVNKPWVEV